MRDVKQNCTFHAFLYVQLAISAAHLSHAGLLELKLELNRKADELKGAFAGIINREKEVSKDGSVNRYR